MNRLLALLIVAALFFPLAANSVTQSKKDMYTGKGVSLTLADPIGSVYRAGEEVGFSIRTDTDAYVIVFDVDTDGFVHLLYPEGRGSLQRISSDQVYRLPEDPDHPLVVGGAKGIEFVFALSVANLKDINEEEVKFLADNDRLPADRRFRITGDPMLGANEVASQLVRGISSRPGVSLSYTYFYVDEAVDYPRYLCEDCYESGKDPYAEGMPQYVATADFEHTSGLAYPLEEGFAPEDSAASIRSTSTGAALSYSDDGGDNLQGTKVYVSYYPRWDTGFYSTSWWYLDPWYWDWWYYPYSPGIHIGIGWDWWGWSGWAPCHYRYFPYYYWGASYPYWYNWYYPAYRPFHGSWRTFRPIHKGGYSSGLHTAMNYRTTRDFRSRQYATTWSPKSGRESALRRSELLTKRTFKSGTPNRQEPRVIRSRPTDSSKYVRGGFDRETRDVRSKRTSYREQRVITRSPRTIRSGAGYGKRVIDTPRSKGYYQQPGRTTRGWHDPRMDGTPKRGRSGSETRGSYKPNVRRSDGGSVAPRSSQSSGRSSSKGSVAPQSRGGSRSKR